MRRSKLAVAADPQNFRQVVEEGLGVQGCTYTQDQPRFFWGRASKYAKPLGWSPVTGHRSSPEIAERVKTPLVFLYHDLRPSEVEIR